MSNFWQLPHASIIQCFDSTEVVVAPNQTFEKVKSAPSFFKGKNVIKNLLEISAQNVDFCAPPVEKKIGQK